MQERSAAEKLSALRTELAKIVESSGVECVWIDVSDARSGKAVRIYIDSRDGVGHAECEAVSRAVGERLDAMDEEGRSWFSGAYSVEVSSPGIERPLFTEEHYRRFCGKKALVVTRDRKKFEGELLSSGEEGVVAMLLPDGSSVSLAFSDIRRGNLVYVLEKGEKKGGRVSGKPKNTGKVNDSRTA
jgi:ribosome maturation factor RimP